MKTKGQKGFAIVNTAVGVILLISGFMLLTESEIMGGFVSIALSAVFGVCGIKTLRLLRGTDTSENTMKTILKVNFIIFILACVLLVACSILPIVGPMFF